MKRLSMILEDTMAAVAFAEAGEAGTVREILNEHRGPGSAIAQLREQVHLTVDDLISMAITFAEAGEHEKAAGILKEAEKTLSSIKGSHQKALRRSVLTAKTN
ncbi:MAG: hypothetical protein C4581_08750 [Nitrospiraceae bacterium]|nr:MAG: hypothetical protein C4581_08750 [Nitrospiraceae bacterium]